MTDHRKRSHWRRKGFFTETLPLHPDDTLSLKCSGPIKVMGIEGPNAIIKGIGDLQWRREGKVVSARFEGPIKAMVPRTVRLQLDMEGPITVQGVNEGAIEVLSSDGQLNVSGGASLRVREADGPLTIADIRGSVQIDETDGPATFRNIGGDIIVDEADGPITIRECRGNIDVTNDGPVYVQLTGALSQILRLRINGSVFLKTPATTRVAGVVRADRNIRIELDQQNIDASDETVTLARPAGDLPVISVDIKAEGDVYIGPNPPAPPETVQQHSGWGWLSAFIGGRRVGRPTRTVTTPPPAAPADRSTSAPRPPEPDVSAEREMILRMVADGKITAEEAAELLEALE